MRNIFYCCEYLTKCKYSQVLFYIGVISVKEIRRIEYKITI
jgi:hypothetical protein